jgi:hypothetical protein
MERAERAGIGVRTVRAVVFTALCVTMSATTHILLSGAPLPLPVLAGVIGTVFCVAFALGGRARSFGTIAVVLTPLELAADTLFNAGQRTCYGPSGGPVSGSWRSLHHAIVCNGGEAGGSLAQRTPVDTAHGLGVSPWLLLAAHVTVGMIAAWWLRRGEATVQRVLLAVAVAAFRPLLIAFAAARGALPVPAPRPRRAARREPGPPSLRPLLHSVVRRGPPVPVAL